MKITFILAFSLMLISSLHAADVKHYEKLKIYNEGEFKSETYYSGMFSTDTVRTTFMGKGPSLKSSTLKDSTAHIIDCPESVNRKVYESIITNKDKKNNLCFDNLKIGQCIQIDYPNAKIFFVEFEYKVSLINAKYASEEGIPIIWVGMENKEGLKDICFYFSDFSEGEPYRRAELAGVVDVDHDGNHEIVIDDIRYAGRRYNVIKIENGNPVQKEVSGDSWD